MRNQTLLCAVVVATGVGRPAWADFGAPQITHLLRPSESDLALVEGTPARLARNDQAQPGAEMSHLAFFGDGTETSPNSSGLYFEMRSGELNGNLPINTMQLAMVPFHLAQNPDGSVAAVGDMAGAKFVTSNLGSETRNANNPSAYSIAGGNAICAEYNYQPVVGLGDTQRFMQCFNRAGATIMPQTPIYAKLGDDCSMNQDTSSTYVVRTSGNVTKLIAWRGCNGSAEDAGWMTAFTVTVDNAANPTTAKFAQQMDVALCQEEERSRGYCTASAADPNTAICSWTEGNTQPQRDGTWLAAVDITDTTTGVDRQDAILWKRQIDGVKGEAELRTYSMRAMHTRVMTPGTTPGRLDASDLIIWRSGDVHSSDVRDGGKGGTYLGNQMAVIKVGRTDMTYVVPLTNMQNTLIGLDGAHLGMGAALFGTSGKLTPGVTFIGGSPIGGGHAAKVRAVGWDQAASKFTDLGTYAIAPYDHHLYSNYLGNNPGSQGRNFSGAVMIPNPFFRKNDNLDEYLSVITTTGKDPSEISRPELKLSSYITVFPTVHTPAGTGSGSGSDSDQDDTGGDVLGGCGGCDTNGATPAALLVILLPFIRRRRRR